MQKINILQLITGLGMGGAEKTVLDLASQCDKKIFNTYVVALSAENELLGEFIKNDINPTILAMPNSFFGLISMLRTLNKFIKNNNINIIHTHLAHSIMVASILGILHPKIKIIYTSHNLNIGSKLREFIVWCLKPFRDIDIILSQDIVRFFNKKRHKIIQNGIKIDKYNLGLEKNKQFTFIAVGRLEAVKNHKFLIEIASRLKNDFSFKLDIVGGGGKLKELDNLIKQYDVGDCVAMLGIKNNVAELLNRSHCLLMPSLWEGLPIVILEAGASSLPIISTPVGGIPSLLNDTNAYVCALDSFAFYMKDVLQNYERATQKGRELFRVIEQQYSIEKIIDAHEAVYKSLQPHKPNSPESKRG